MSITSIPEFHSQAGSRIVGTDSSLMVTQCGLSTTMKALSFGVPLVCIPLVADQPDNAARVEAQGAGIRLADAVSPEQIANAIQRILDQPRYRVAAERIAKLLIAEDGARQAANALEDVAKERD